MPATSGPDGVPSSADVTKLLVVVVENHSLDQMRTGMPDTFALAQRFGYATHYSAVSHPSLPNYLAIASGSTHGIADDDDPAGHRLTGSTVFGQALAAGRTAGLFAEGMTGTCGTTNEGGYAVRHNPWAYFTDERSACEAGDRPYSDLAALITAGRLPDAGMAIPDVCHDAHDCDLSEADAWFRTLMDEVFAGPDWASGHLAVVLTADEDDHHQDNRVLTAVIHPSQHANVVDTPLDHYSLTRLYDDVLHTSPLGEATSAASMSDAFGLPLR